MFIVNLCTDYLALRVARSCRCLSCIYPLGITFILLRQLYSAGRNSHPVSLPVSNEIEALKVMGNNLASSNLLRPCLLGKDSIKSKDARTGQVGPLVVPQHRLGTLDLESPLVHLNKKS